MGKRNKLILFIFSNLVFFFNTDIYLSAQWEFGDVGMLKPVPPRVIYSGHRASKKVALTLDDGWVDDEPLLELLLSYNIKCTVFIPGRVAAARPEFVRKLDSYGFEVCNHTYSHSFLTRLSDDQIRKELNKAQTELFSLTGKSYPYMRPPGGNCDARIASIAAEEGYMVILWDNDVQGYRDNQTVEDQLKYLRFFKKPGNIILAHFGASLHTYEVLKILIPEMLEEGYEFVTITELLEEEERIREDMFLHLPPDIPRDAFAY